MFLFFAKIREKSKIFTLVPKYMHYFYVENKCMLIHETKIANMPENVQYIVCLKALGWDKILLKQNPTLWASPCLDL